MEDETTGDPRVGTVVQDRYRILERLADGSMGVVYRGERLQIGRQVAIKFLHASYAGDRQFIQRFERETVVMSKLSHPHCVSVIDFGLADAPYVVMEFVAGVTLRSLLERGRLPAERAAAIIRQVLAGLAHAHAQGVVHRDIKPANIMLTDATGTGDHVRILDFGLATLRNAHSSDLSQTAIVVGTPNYMSPEQSMATKVDLRSDLYSTGVVLFELCTGQKPFGAEETFELFEQHRTAPVPRLSEMAPEAALPTGLQDVIDRALAKKPEDRFASAMEFAEALESVVARSASGSFQPQAVGSEGQSAASMTELAHAPTREMTSMPEPAAEVPRRTLRLVRPLLVLALLGGAAYAGVRVWPALAEKDEGGAISASRSVAGQEDRTPPAPVKQPAPVTPPAGEPSASEMTFEVPEVLGDAGPSAEGLTGDAGAPALASEEDAEEPPEPIFPDDEQDEPVAPVADDPDEVDNTSADDEPDEEEPEADPAAATGGAAQPPPRPKPIDSVKEAVSAIRAGRRQAALRALLILKRKNPKSAYIPYLIGNLYFEKKWWSDGMRYYKAAIRNHKLYRSKRILNQNLVRALGKPKTRRKAIALFVYSIGRPALPHLKRAARSDKNPEVRRQAARLVKRLSPHKRRRRR